MATLNQLRTRVDNWLADKWPTIVARQENYRANRGRYWQGLKTHTACPAHTNGGDGDVTGDRLDQSPDDQAWATWLNVFPEWLSELLPACVWIDTYDGPSGQGWVANIEVIYNGVKYRRSRNVGPDDSRTAAWHEVPAIPSPI